jgi:hypothetical protein
MTDYERMSDFEINKAIAAIDSALTPAYWKEKDGRVVEIDINDDFLPLAFFDPCNNPSDAWPIICDANISIDMDRPRAVEVEGIRKPFVLPEEAAQSRHDRLPNDAGELQWIENYLRKNLQIKNRQAVCLILWKTNINLISQRTPEEIRLDWHCLIGCGKVI